MTMQDEVREVVNVPRPTTYITTVSCSLVRCWDDGISRSLAPLCLFSRATQHHTPHGTRRPPPPRRRVAALTSSPATSIVVLLHAWIPCMERMGTTY